METNEPEHEAIGVRNQFVLQFAEILALDQNLWRIELEYLSSCGLEGRKRAQVLLKRVAADGGGAADLTVRGDAMLVEQEGKAGRSGEDDVVTEVLEISSQLGMEELAREICQVRVYRCLAVLQADPLFTVACGPSHVSEELRRSSVLLRSCSRFEEDYRHLGIDSRRIRPVWFVAFSSLRFLHRHTFRLARVSRR